MDLVKALTRGWAIPVLLAAAVFTIFGRQWTSSEVGCSLFPAANYMLYSDRVVLPDGVIAAAVEVQGGRIVAVRPQESPPAAAPGMPVLDFSGAALLPGFVDTHVHLNEPGRTDWEGFETGTRAAAAAGVTTIVEMPLNSIPTTTTREALEIKIAAARGKLFVDTGFWGGLVPDNARNGTVIEELLRAGALGLKSFMCPSGIPEFDFTRAEHFRVALPLLARFGRPLLVHAEIPLPLDPVPEGADADPREYQTFLRTRPPEWERAAIQELLDVAQGARPGQPWSGARVHIVHLADAESVALIEAAKQTGIPVTVETCPHYLTFSEADVGTGATSFKCTPPIRSEKNREQLWESLKEGKIDMVASDHSPAPPAVKLVGGGDFLQSWGGIASLQWAPSITWSEGHKRGVTLTQLADWWSARPATLAGLTQKGAIEVGKDADFVVWDPEGSFIVDPQSTLHRHKSSPYMGRVLTGRVVSTFIRGQQVYKDGKHAQRACGAMLLGT